jgi:hypothetical protein
LLLGAAALAAAADLTDWPTGLLRLSVAVDCESPAAAANLLVLLLPSSAGLLAVLLLSCAVVCESAVGAADLLTVLPVPGAGEAIPLEVLLLLLTPGAECGELAGPTDAFPVFLLVLPVNLKGDPLLAVPLLLMQLLPLPRSAVFEPAAGATDVMAALQLSNAEDAGMLGPLLLPSVAALVPEPMCVLMELLPPSEPAAVKPAELLVALGLPGSLPILTVASVTAAVCLDGAAELWGPSRLGARC